MQTFDELQERVKSLPINAPDMATNLTYHLTGLSSSTAKLGALCQPGFISNNDPDKIDSVKENIGTCLIILASISNLAQLD